jgi:hypothetical protein
MAAVTKADLQAQVANQQERLAELEAAVASHIEDREILEGALAEYQTVAQEATQMVVTYADTIVALHKELGLADRETTDALAVGDGVAQILAGAVVELHEQVQFAANAFNSIVLYGGADIDVARTLAQGGLLAIAEDALQTISADDAIANVTAQVVEELGLGEEVPGNLTDEDVANLFEDLDICVGCSE